MSNFKKKLQSAKKKIFTKKEFFSIVTATYNSENYLEDYFESIISNNYKKLEMIIVDDGSSDNSKKIINSYSKKLNIKYIYQENQGQAIARNNGLKYVTSKWVTFIDSDDFVGDDYFKEVNEAIYYSKGNSIISTKWLNYYEETKDIKDDHALTYRFSEKYRNINVLEFPNDFQLAMNSVFFKKEMIDKYKIVVPNIKPQFEDAMFVSEYLRLSNNYNICFASDAKYMYRKRSNNTSTLNLANKDTHKYTSLLNEGYIAILESYLPNIPSFVKNMVIYDLSWNIKELENNRGLLKYEEIKLREEYLQKIFSYIDFSQLVKNWKYLWKMYLIGINNRYYNNKGSIHAGAYYFYETSEFVTTQLISIENKWTFLIGGEKVSINDMDYRVYKEKLNGDFFVYKYYVKLPKNKVKVYYDNIELEITNQRKDYQINIFNENALCIFFDRVSKADDNAEVLYDYMLKNHSNYKNLYFAIDFESNDIKRLKSKGFKLIDYKSQEFIEMYTKANFIFSSGFGGEIENINNLRYPSYKCKANFIFLQHGIITDNLVDWFSTKRVDKIVTSCDFEYNNLLNNYTFFDDQIIKTCLPRFDKLYNDPKGEILLQFTWRRRYQDFSVEDFFKTKYAQDIINILSNEKLLLKLKNSNIKIKFIPHPEVNKYIEIFSEYNNDHVEILNANEIIFREQFASANLLITDYSSIFNDFIYLNKKVIFFQENKEEFFAGHMYEEDLDYEKNGVGPVIKDVELLVEEIIKSIDEDFVIEDLYEERIKNYFSFIDQNSCKRLFTAMQVYK